MRSIRIVSGALFISGALLAQTNSGANPIVNSSKGFYSVAKDDIMRSAEKVPEDLWSFRPTPEVRTFGQMFAHVADGQYEFCGAAAGNAPNKNIEQTVKGKAATIAALKEAFAFCDALYAKATDTDAARIVSFMGQRSSMIGILDFNTAHTMEHYGNLVTYMRIKGIVPPSSEPKK